MTIAGIPIMKRLLRRLRGVPLMLMILGGCSSAGPIPKAPILMTSEDFMAQRLDNPEVLNFINHAQGHTPSAEWNFQSLYWAALYYNPSLKEAKAMVSAAKGAQMTAGQSPNPTFNVSPSFDNSTTPSAWLLGVGLNIPIETNGKREFRENAAQHQTDSARYQLVSKAWDIRSQLLNSLVDLHTAKETMHRNQALLATQAAIVTEYDKRASQGQMPTANASQAQVNYQQTSLQLEQAKTAIAHAQVALAGAVGVPVEAIIAAQITDALPAADITETVDRETILRQHPAMLSALADYRAAHELLKLEVAKRIPDVDIGPGYEWNSQQGGKFTLGISLVLPIANDNEGPIAEANGKRLVAAKHVEVVQAAIINQMQQAYGAYRSAVREQQAAQAIMALQTTKQQRLNESMTQKASAALPLLYAANDVQSARVAELPAYAILLKAKVAWEDAIRQPVFGAVIDQKTLMRGVR